MSYRPVLLNALLLYLKNKYKKSKYTYRFVLLPETIGSIAYISKRLKILKQNTISGYVLTCVGDERCYSMVNTPNENTLADFSLNSALIGLDKVKKYSFIHRGSDERQYCAPGVDLPVSAFLRSKTYPEYHTSKDDFNLVTEKGLNGSFEVMKNIIDAFETGLYPKFKNYCEPQLGKRNLYTVKFSKKDTYAKELYIRKKFTCLFWMAIEVFFEISNILQVPLRNLLDQYVILKKSNDKLMKNVFSEININIGDTVLVSSDILKILLLNKKKLKEKISPNDIIDMLKEKIGSTGNLLFPTYNWGFCQGKVYHYKKTRSLCGTLSNTALQRNDFVRTKNPIYSFAVYGKDMELISNMHHKDCFSLDSPFGYLIKKKLKIYF